jgi:hypothetical protein
LAGTELEQ